MWKEGGGNRVPTADLIRTIRAKREEGFFIQEVHYPKGSTLYTENEPAYYAYLIEEGFVDQVKRTLSGKRFILDRLGPGELLGVEALTGDIPYRVFCAEAVTDVRALLLDLTVWEEVLAAYEARHAILQLFGQALLHRDLRIGTLLTPGAPERIRETWAYLQRKFHSSSPPPPASRSGRWPSSPATPLRPYARRSYKLRKGGELSSSCPCLLD